MLRKPQTLWIPALLLAVLLLSGCARGERLRSGVPLKTPAADVTAPTEAVDGDLNELDQMLGDLENELKNTDTQIDIP